MVPEFPETPLILLDFFLLLLFSHNFTPENSMTSPNFMHREVDAADKLLVSGDAIFP